MDFIEYSAEDVFAARVNDKLTKLVMIQWTKQNYFDLDMAGLISTIAEHWAR